MSQQYQRELDFAVSLLQRLRIPVRIIHPEEIPFSIDEEIIQMLGLEKIHEDAYRAASRWSEEKTFYKIVNSFRCRYIYFLLPGAPRFTSVVIGPYLTEDLTPETIRKLAEDMKLPMYILPQLVSYYMSLPVQQDTSALNAILSTLGDSLWNGSEFNVMDVNYEQQIRLPAAASDHALIEQENILREMEQMEARYAYENELLEIVSRGQTSRADMIMSNISSLHFQLRHADPLRSIKNYCIVCNTLLRKAAQQGGVHPFHLDQISSRFAHTIESTPSQEKCVALIGEMVHDYCHLVRASTGTRYSLIIQKTILYAEANLSGDLSLTTLAKLMQVTPSYLSARFHREVGHTLAKHITELRMKTALQLLSSSHLQIQSVAQLCGFPDPNYFSKQFKQFYGITPLQYRKSQRPFAKGFHGDG